MSAQKRRASAPFPIFNKGKRPRKALLAHPNNMGGGPAQAQQSVQSQWSGYTPSPTPSPRSGDSGSAGSYTASNDHYGREVQLPFPTPPRAPHQYGYGGTGCAAEQQENQQMAMSRASHQRTGFTPYQAGPQQLSGQSWGISASPSCRPHSQSDSGVGRGRTTMVGRAKAGVSFGVSPSPSRTKPRGCIRVLTATAKGMEHWSKYKQHTQMIFEVFGMLCTTVTLGNQGAKEFTIKTSDGLVKCVFWEMDRCLPHLIRGHVHRVVGLWDANKRFLKSYSVRPAQPKEEACAREFVRVSDHSMRETVAAMHES